MGEDRDQCRGAGIPDDVRYRPMWRLAGDQWGRLSTNGVSLDWLVFDEEGSGSKVPFLRFLNLVGQRLVAEVSVNFTVRETAGGLPGVRTVKLTAADARAGKRHQVAHRSVHASFWCAPAGRA